MWKTALILVCMACVRDLVAPAWGGEVHGRVVISRTLTKKRISVPNYQMRGPSLPPPRAEPALTAEFSKIAIYVEGDAAAAPADATKTATLTQKNQRFEPEIVVIPVGSTVSFPNGDPIFHNVFSLSPARQFDLGTTPPEIHAP